MRCKMSGIIYSLEFVYAIMHILFLAFVFVIDSIFCMKT